MSNSIRQAASEWFVEFRAGEPNEACRKAFHDWLQVSPAHMAAYLEIAALWDASASLDAGAKWSMEGLIEAARADAGNIVPFEATARITQRTGGAQGSKAGVRGFAAIAASVLVSVAIVRLCWIYTQRDIYTTRTGEQRSMILSDGSTVEINARSSIQIHYTKRERRVDLLKGQALFTVAKNKDRPFIVQSNGAQVRAIGTRFDVNQHSNETVVTVLEGTVAITDSAAGASEGASLVAAGEQLTVDPTIPPKKKARPANLATAIAWTQRQLIF